MTRPAWTYISSTNGITDFSSLNSNVAITAPTNIAGCFAWYRADLGITLSSSFVTDWADQSGNNRNFTQATPAIRPTYVVSSASFNNKPVLVFGGSHYMQTVAFGALLQPFTYYIVGKANNVASYFLGSLTGGVNEVGLLANIGGNFVLYAGVTALSNNSLSTTLIPQTTCGIFNAANSLGYIDNSVTDILTSHNVSTNTPTGFTLGATYIPSNYLDGYIAEIIVYSGSHTTAQRTSVMQYLSGRYATPGRIIANISSSLSFTRNSPATVQTGLSTLVSMSIDANVAVIGRTLNTDTFGLQHEEARQNFIRYSRTPTTTGGIWAGAGIATFTPIYAVGPDGTLSGSRFNATSAQYSNFSPTTLPATLSSSYAISSWQQPVTASSGGYQVYWINQGVTVVGMMYSGSFPIGSTSWQRLAGSKFIDNAAAGQHVFLDNRALGFGGTSISRDNVVDYAQIEAGGFSTSAIATTGSQTTRSGTRIQYLTGSSRVDNGRFNLELDIRPLGSSTAYLSGTSAMRLWTDATNATNYVEVNSSSLCVTMSINSLQNLTNQLPSWNANDRLRLFVGCGGNLSSSIYALVGTTGSVTSLQILSGSPLGYFNPTGSIDLLSDGVTKQFSSWVVAETTYTNQNSPSWSTVPTLLGQTTFSTLNLTSSISLPTEISGCQLWLKADAGITLNGSTISVWADQSGLGRHVSQSVKGLQPTFIPSTSSYNNQSVVAFISSSNYLDSAIFTTLPQPLTYYIAGNVSGAGTEAFIDVIGNGSTEIAIYGNAGRASFYAGNAFISNATITSPSLINAVANSTNSSLYANTITSASFLGVNIGSASPTSFKIGATFPPSGFLNGNIAEILVYIGVHTVLQRQNVMLYLSNKYNISISAAPSITMPSGLSFARNSPATVQTGTSTLISSSIDANIPVIGRILDTDTFGLQHEISSSNLVIDSRDMGAASWTAGLSDTLTLDFAAGPDGAVLADRNNVVSAGVSKFRTFTSVASNYSFSSWQNNVTASSVTSQITVTDGTTQTATVTSGCVQQWNRFGGSRSMLASAASFIAPIEARNGNGAVAGAKDFNIDYTQMEQSGYITSAIPTSGTIGQRAGTRIQYLTGSSRIDNGRINLELILRPIASSIAFQNGFQNMRLWTDATNANNYAEISSASLAISMSVGGILNVTSGSMFAWAANDTLKIFVGMGGNIPSVAYVSGSTVTNFVISGSSLGVISPTGSIDLLSDGTTKQFSCWLLTERTYTGI